MTDSHEQQAREDQLELLLRELLGEDTGIPGGASNVDVVLPEVAELADMARRLRAASEEASLPSGRTAKALLATGTARNGDTQAGRGVVRWRPRRWVAVAGLAAAAAVLILGAFDIGTSLAWNAGSPASPWYGARVTLVELQVALVPSPLRKAEKLVKAMQTRIAEIEAIASSPDIPTLRRAADALDSEAGWLHAVTTTLPPAEQAQVTSQLIAATGTFSEGRLQALSRGVTFPRSEYPAAPLPDRKTRVSTVARAAAQLKAEGKLPQGLTVGGLVTQAAGERAAAPAAPAKPEGSISPETTSAGGSPWKQNQNRRPEPGQTIPGQFPYVANLRPYASESNFMSLPGYLRYLTHQRTHQWLTLGDATRIVRHERAAPVRGRVGR